MAKRDIRKTSLPDLKTWITSVGEKAFRAQQIEDWLWNKWAKTWDEMANLPKSLRSKLEEEFDIKTLEVSKSQKSSDGTIKAAFKLFDSNLVEGVLIPCGEVIRLMPSSTLL